MPDQVLYCKPGAHEWARKAQRGRKPDACPEHVGQEIEIRVPGVLPGREKLYCKIGRHDWTRPKGQRGRKPDICPDHAPVQAQPAKPRTKPQHGSEGPLQETLHCEAGDHEWSRPVQKGAKPKNCPDHRTAAGASKPDISLDRLRELYHPSPEDERVIAYIDGELERMGRTEPVGPLLLARADRVRRMRMRTETAMPDVDVEAA